MTRTIGGDTPRRFAQTSGPVSAFPRPRAQWSSSTPDIVIPAGALDRWFNYRTIARTAATRRSIVCFGDSTMFGSGGNYSWLQRLRDRIAAAGYADGGKGIFSGGEPFLTYDAPEVNGVVGTPTVTGAPDNYDVLGGGHFMGANAGESVTFQFRETNVRLWWVKRNDGDITYSIDGGAAQTVHLSTLSGDPTDFFTYISGLAANTTHTMVVTNRGGRDPIAPANCTLNVTGSPAGSFSTGTYYYVATYTFSGGETTPSPVSSIAVSGSQSVGITVPNVGQDSATLYRSTSSGGPFEKVAGITYISTTSQVAVYNDAGTAVSSGVTPPTVMTTNLNASMKNGHFTIAPVNDTGISIQKHAISGQTINTFFHTGSITGAHQATRYQAALGLVPTTVNGGNSPTSADGYTSGNTLDTSIPAAARVNPVLGMFQLAFNDLTNQANTDYSVYTEGVKKFGAACRAAGCDGIVLAGQLPYNTKWPTYGAAVYNALRSTAIAQGLAFVDFFHPIGGPSLSYSGGTNNPHLTKVQYQAQADFLWDNLLGV